MHRYLRRALALPLVALALCLLACDPSWFTVEIPDFGSNQIQGVWVWRFSEQSRHFERDTLIHFDGVTYLNSGFALLYTAYSSQGDLSLTAGIVPCATNPAAITVTLAFDRGASGVFRVSTYNAVGESSLSEQVARF